MKNKLYSIITTNRNLAENIFGSIFIKGLSMILSFMTLSAYLDYFENQDILGVWLVMVAVLTWILTFDLGVGNGLRNHLVAALVSDNIENSKKYISSAYTIIGSFSLIILIVGFVAINIIDWNSFFNVKYSAINKEKLSVIVLIVFCSIIFQFFFKLILSILNALQKTALANSLSLMSNLFIYFYVILSNGMDLENSLYKLAIVYLIATNLPLIVTSMIVFSTTLKSSKPSFKYWSKEFAGKIMKLGYMFFWIQITLLIINLTNEFLITQLFSPKEVIEYQVYNRYFIIYLTLFSILTTPIWSAVTKAYKEKNFLWVIKISRYLNLVALLLILIIFITLPFFQIIVDIWLQKNSILVDMKTSIMFGIFYSVLIFIYSVTCIANGIGELKTQIITNTIAAIVKIPLAIYLSKFTNSWDVIILVNIIIMLPSAIIQPLILRRHLNNKILKNK